MGAPLLALLIGFGAEPTSALSFGAEAFGEFYPSSTESVPMMSRAQQSVLTGVRLAFGVRFADAFRGFALFEVGYAAAGVRAGNGQDGLMVGVGAEGDWLLYRWFIPFVRLTGDFRVAQWSTLRTGTLAERALVFSIGVRALRFLDVHVLAGNDFAGGSSVGFGAGLGWQWELELEQPTPELEISPRP